MSGGRALALLFAHPDDETFAAGGAVAAYAAAGVACHLFCATDGDAGKSSGIAVATRAELGPLRRAELAAAAGILGIRSVHLAGHADGALPEYDADALTGELVAFLREHRPQVVITFGPEGAPNGHRDHRALSRAATAAFHLAARPTAYPEQLAAGRRVHQAARLYYVTWEPPPLDDPKRLEGVPATARVDTRARHATKRAAFRAHRTQAMHEATFERLSMTPDELYALAGGTPQRAAVVADLFDGLPD